jgi:hypothetical protein
LHPLFPCNSEDIGECIGLLKNIGNHLKANVFAIEYSDYGFTCENEKPDPQLIKQDAIDICNYVNIKLKFHHKNIIVFGRSIECGVACYLAFVVTQVENLVLMSPPASVKAIASDLTCNQIRNKIDDFFIQKVVCQVYSRQLINHSL